ncbi:MAG TPA: dihydroneopterin aldolase [Polyangiaceae bacterium]|jgi:dihydroneopterin aldolase|nr:dihydroneopterin aldolase [Polyangiaceae bacterium]
MTNSGDRILIDALDVECIVGIRPAERVRKQHVRVHLDLGLDLARAGKSGRIAHTVNYSRVASEVTDLLQFRAYNLIEVATEEIAASLLALHPALERVTLRVEKPEALRGRARSAAVEVTRTRAGFVVTRNATSFGELESIHECDEARLFIAHIAAGKSFAQNETRARRLEWLVHGHLSDAGHELVPHLARVREAGAGARLTNTSNEQAALFCCETTLT